MTGEKEFFSDSIRQCEGSMYALALGMLQNEADAADVMQDALLKAYCNLEHLKDRNKFRPWILSIVHNTAIEYLRKRRDLAQLEEQEELAAPAADADTRLTVWDTIQKLKLPYRTVIILFYYENYSVRQIADVTQMSAIAIKQQLSRGRKMLAQLLHKEDFTQ